MEPNRQRFSWFWQVAMGVLLASTVFAQSSNRDAVKWFNAGLKERDDSKAIEAYKKAIELDGGFVEAMINLGMRYKTAGELEQAEVYLQRALDTRPEKIADDLKFKLQFEIANIYLRKNDISGYEARVEAARQATTNTSLLATLSFEHGRFLYQNQRYREAVLELQRGLRSNPPNKQYFENMIDLAEKAQQIEGLYERATREEQSGNLENALTLYREIDGSSPDFRDVAQRISDLQARIDQARRSQNLEKLYSQAVAEASKGNLEAAIRVYENILRSEPTYKDVRERLATTQRQFAAKSSEQELNGKYNEAVLALRGDNLTRAIVLFEEIIERDAGFRDAGRQLEVAKKRIESKTAEVVVQRYYQDGISDLARGENLSALNAFKKVAAIDPDFKDVAEKIVEAESRLFDAVETAQQNENRNEAIAAQVDSLMAAAAAQADAGALQQALLLLEQANTIMPRNENVIHALAELRAQLNAEQAGRVAVGQNGIARILMVAGGAIAVLIVLPLAGAFFLVPTVRMRYYLMVGNLMRAASIIERLLDQNPGRLKLYPTLANIYLLEKRSDDRAIKVYRTVAQLNLTTQNKRAIEAMLANYYMVESGEADQEAIKILEDRLQAELRQRKSK